MFLTAKQFGSGIASALIAAAIFIAVYGFIVRRSFDASIIKGAALVGLFTFVICFLIGSAIARGKFGSQTPSEASSLTRNEPK